MRLDPDGKLLFRAYLDRVPTSEDRELLLDALLETAFSFPEIQDHRLECLFSEEPFGELDKLDDWLFVRAEEANDEPDH